MRTKTLSCRLFAVLCVLLLIASILPLFILSSFNHPFYDDFGFSLLTRKAWQETGDVGAVLAAAWQNTQGIRHTWEGTYTTSFISTLQPGIFSEDLYWLTTVLLLSALMLSLWFFLRQSLARLLQMDGFTFTSCYCVLAFLMVQLVPDVAEAFFWFNGGVAYTLMWTLLLAVLGLWFCLLRCEKRTCSALITLSLALLMVLLGGAKYSLLLTGSLLFVGFTLWAFIVRRPARFNCLVLTLLFLSCFAFSALAPGNQVRAATLGNGLSAPMSIAQSLYFGLALIGHWATLPLLSSLVGLTLLLLPTLRRSGLRFSHPIWVTLLMAGLFCTQLTPTLYTGNFLGDGRVLNTYYYTYVLMAFFLLLYWAGWLLRIKVSSFKHLPIAAWINRIAASDSNSTTKLIQAAAIDGTAFALENDSSSLTNKVSPPAESPRRVDLLPVCITVLLLAVGCLGYLPDGAEIPGPQHMAGGSALRSLLKGEAQDFDRQMDERNKDLNDFAQPSVVLHPVQNIPSAFMGDAFDAPSLSYVLSLYQEYYRKETVSLSSPLKE